MAGTAKAAATRPGLLVVETNDAIRSLLCDWLETQFPAWHCLPAATPEDAYRAALAEHPAAALVNLDMAGDVGFDVLQRLRHELPRARLAAVSMLCSASDRTRAALAGADACLSLDGRDARLRKLLGTALAARASAWAAGNA